MTQSREKCSFLQAKQEYFSSCDETWYASQQKNIKSFKKIFLCGAALFCVRHPKCLFPGIYSAGKDGVVGRACRFSGFLQHNVLLSSLDMRNSHRNIPLKGRELSEKRGKERRSKSRKWRDAPRQSQILTSRKGSSPAGVEQNPCRKTKAEFQMSVWAYKDFIFFRGKAYCKSTFCIRSQIFEGEKLWNGTW